MPAKSKAQFKKMFILAKEDQISQDQLQDFTHNVNYKKLPKKVPIKHPAYIKGGKK